MFTLNEVLCVVGVIIEHPMYCVFDVRWVVKSCCVWLVQSLSI